MEAWYRTGAMLFLVAVIIHVVRETAGTHGTLATILIGFELAAGFAAVTCAFRWAVLIERSKRS
jgi:hypothetical protein